MHFRYLYSKISTKDQPSSSIKSVRAPPAKTISMVASLADNNDNHNYYGDAFSDDPAVPACYGVEMDITIHQT